MRKLKELVVTKDKFFKIIGHDLKNPISQIMQFSQLLELRYKSLSEEKFLYFIQILQMSSRRSLNLLENLLNWARSQTGDISYYPRNLSLLSLVNEVIILLKSSAENKNITIHNKIPYEIKIRADRNMLHTILRNLVSNAIKYTFAEGEVTISAVVMEHDIEIMVKDSGKGISEENLKKLFHIERGFSTDGTNNEKGTGIGLILSKEFVEKHKGKIWVESEENKGCTFKFTIPLDKKEKLNTVKEHILVNER